MENHNQKKELSKFEICMRVFTIISLIFGAISIIYAIDTKKDNIELKKSYENIGDQLSESKSSSLSFQNDLTNNVGEINNKVDFLVKSQVAVAITTQQIAKTTTTQIVEDYQDLAFETKDGIPSSSYTNEIKKNQIGVFTSGPVNINGNFLKGGADPDRGSVVVLLPDGDTTIYTFNELVPNHNWFGIFDVNEVNPNNIRILTNKYINEMRKSPNGTSRNGCTVIDILILSGLNIYSGPETLYF